MKEKEKGEKKHCKHDWLDFRPFLTGWDERCTKCGKLRKLIWRYSD